MPDFVKVRKKRSFKERLGIITLLLNQNRSVTVKQLVMKWGLGPDYCRKLLRWAAEILPYAEFDEESNSLGFAEAEAELKKEIS
jgi:hypothetical protein